MPYYVASSKNFGLILQILRNGSWDLLKNLKLVR